ncbi:E3 ubiquitin-protein ligase ATL23 [Camellia lanceoleosa]|uniref:E3 ubiquitin-protein ligase ATL23 n=1 Tax=Camellia lanceoleosa TaxID=1840588 RepID=A0ACC0GR90_9ERIC|nr:E3 ubiquitin-protein ligase ATL23 [Camellia lanceoleosa]
MSAVFVVYLCLLWYAANIDSNRTDYRLPEKPEEKSGLTAAELEKLPKITGKELAMGTECAVCLDEIEVDQPARLVSPSELFNTIVFEVDMVVMNRSEQIGAIKVPSRSSDSNIDNESSRSEAVVGGFGERCGAVGRDKHGV